MNDDRGKAPVADRAARITALAIAMSSRFGAAACVIAQDQIDAAGTDEIRSTWIELRAEIIRRDRL